MTDHPYREAGRRLKAAFVSYQLGRAGVDRTLKEVPEDAPFFGPGGPKKTFVSYLANQGAVRRCPSPKPEGARKRARRARLRRAELHKRD